MAVPTDHTDNILTTLRLSVWQAIDNWPALSGVFNRKNRFDDDAAMLAAAQAVAIGDLPAIELFPVQISPEWKTHRMKRVPYVLQCLVHTARLSEAEWLLPTIWEAIHRATPDGEMVPYVKAGGSLYPRDNGWSIEPGTLGRDTKIPVIRGTITMAFELQADPLAREGI